MSPRTHQVLVHDADDLVAADGDIERARADGRVRRKVRVGRVQNVAHLAQKDHVLALDPHVALCGIEHDTAATGLGRNRRGRESNARRRLTFLKRRLLAALRQVRVRGRRPVVNARPHRRQRPRVRRVALRLVALRDDVVGGRVRLALKVRHLCDATAGRDTVAPLRVWGGPAPPRSP